MKLYEAKIVIDVEADSLEKARQLAEQEFDDCEFNFRDHGGIEIRCVFAPCPDDQE